MSSIFIFNKQIELIYGVMHVRNHGDTRALHQSLVSTYELESCENQEPKRRKKQSISVQFPSFTRK